jgi:hypothetical protein
MAQGGDKYELSPEGQDFYASLSEADRTAYLEWEAEQEARGEAAMHAAMNW